MILLNLMMNLKFKILKHLLELALLDFKCLRYREGYVMNVETTRDILACRDRDDLEKLLCKYKEKSLNARMKCDPKFATSPIFIDDKDYEFSVDPELITLVECDPFHG